MLDDPGGAAEGFVVRPLPIWSPIDFERLQLVRSESAGPEGGVTVVSGAEERRRRREDLSRRAVAAGVALAREHGTGVEEPTVLNDLFSLMVHLRPAPVVALVATCMPRLRSPIEVWLNREIAVTTFLSDQGAPVVAPSRELPPGPHVYDGFPISFWTRVQPDPDRAVTADDCSSMLVDLHAALRSYPGELPLLAANDIPRGLAALDQAGDVLSETEAGLLHATAGRLRPLWGVPSGDLQPLHGDAHPGNLIATRDGLVWIDFEDACRGPVEWDLATMMSADAVVTHHEPDPGLLAQCTDLRALQVALVLIMFRDDLGDVDGWDAGLRSILDMLAES